MQRGSDEEREKGGGGGAEKRTHTLGLELRNALALLADEPRDEVVGHVHVQPTVDGWVGARPGWR
jgi:hypothetical protein|eukprot:COSAG01_NODE_1430_length_10325_cov_7.452376_5_plen_65_part_00